MKRQDFSILLSMNTYSMFSRYILFLKKWIRIHFFNPLLTWYKKIIPLTWHAISTCLSAGLCFFSAENILFISYAHLTYPIQQRYNINKQTAAGSWPILLLFRSEYQFRSPSAENTSTSITLPVTFSVLFHQAIFPRMFQFQNLQLS